MYKLIKKTIDLPVGTVVFEPKQKQYWMIIHQSERLFGPPSSYWTHHFDYFVSIQGPDVGNIQPLAKFPLYLVGSLADINPDLEPEG